MRLILWTSAAALGIAAALWAVTVPAPLADAAALPQGDSEAGARVFAAAGCASCHVAPDTEEDGPPVLSGGEAFETAFGTFYAPNISPDAAAGLGDWTDAQIVNAVMHGVSPAGAHYFPSLPYTAYVKARPDDMADMVAYLRTLPASDVPSQPHDLAFPFNQRWLMGFWKPLFLRDYWVVPDSVADDDTLRRGRYLVEALGHCGECHTPRNALGGLRVDAWLTGAENPSGEGRIPGITPAQLDWSAGDIRAYLTSGLTPDYDSAGGSMVAVIDKLAQLPEDDIDAIVAYLKALPEAGQP